MVVICLCVCVCLSLSLSVSHFLAFAHTNPHSTPLYTGIEIEKRRRAAADFVPPDDYQQGDTDWDATAVVDEDDLD